MTTPFYFQPVAYPGIDPGVDPGLAPLWRVGDHPFWLGQPGAMVKLPSPNPDGYTANATSAEVVHGLFGGGTALTRFASSTRQWTIGWPRLAGRDWQVVNGFYRRLFGADPWCFLPPEDVNRLTLAQSMAGDLNDVAEGWLTTSGTLAFDITLVPPLQPCGVLRWTSPAVSAHLYAGLSYTGGQPVPDPNVSYPYVSAEPLTWSVYVRSGTTTGSASSVRLMLTGIAASGPPAGQVTTVATSVPTSGWTRLTLTAAAGSLGAAVYAIPEIQSVDGTTVLISCPQLEMASVASDWSAGGGTPRVLLTAGLGRVPDIHVNSAATMTLTECYPGAC